jgi:LAS superfamily LD-carboxypeptidase LdcB
MLTGAAVNRLRSRPGTSNHQIGLAVDFSEEYAAAGSHAGICAPKQTAASFLYQWLISDAGKLTVDKRT